MKGSPRLQRGVKQGGKEAVRSYEARLGAAMTKTLGSAVLQLYAGIVSMFLPIPVESQPGLIADLEGEPFVERALSSATCEL